jgi:hypothetical protein
MIYLFWLFLNLDLWANHQAFDFSAGLQGRSLPSLGAEAYAEAGLNQLLWGKKDQPKDVFYGLVRPSLGASTSAVINSLKGELEIFPISFLGFSLGRQMLFSNFDFPFLDCDSIQCQGQFERNFVEGKMVLGHRGWVALGHYKVDVLTSPGDKLPMADWRNVIVGDPGEEVQIEKKLFLGKFFSNKMVGALVENVQFLGSRERKESFAAVYQVRKNQTHYMLGVGAFHTDQQPMGFQFYFRIHQVYLPSLKLF